MIPTFSLCHTTARLPNGWQSANAEWFDKCDNPAALEYILCIDQGHPVGSWRDGKHSVTVVVNHGRKCAVDGWNHTSQMATGKFLISVSDDWFPPEHWDTELLNAIPDLKGEYVIDVDNGEKSYPLLPFSLLTRAYYERLFREYGYEGFFYPGYFGMMADCEFTDLARRDRVVIDARHLKFEHRAPAKGSPEWKADPVYQWQQREEAVRTGKRVYMRRIRELGITSPGFIPSMRELEALVCL